MPRANRPAAAAALAVTGGVGVMTGCRIMAPRAGAQGPGPPAVTAPLPTTPLQPSPPAAAAAAACTARRRQRTASPPRRRSTWAARRRREVRTWRRRTLRLSSMLQPPQSTLGRPKAQRQSQGGRAPLLRTLAMSRSRRSSRRRSSQSQLRPLKMGWGLRHSLRRCTWPRAVRQRRRRWRRRQRRWLSRQQRGRVPPPTLRWR